MQRESESRARGVRALLGMSCFGRRSNNVNEAEIMTDIFGHSNIFATHSLTHSTSIETKKTLSDDICVGARWRYTACSARMAGQAAVFLYPNETNKVKPLNINN